MRKILLFFFLVSCSAKLNAAIFTVTNNLNEGTGSLRQAILDASSNGGSNRIEFAISPAATILDVSIILQTALPKLPSDLVIDATTQVILPNGAKVSIINGTTGQYFNGFHLENVQNVEIYGINFQGFKSDPQALIDEQKAAIFLKGVKNITIGAINKGNSFGGNYAGILSPYSNDRPESEQVNVVANLIGLNPNGTISANSTGIDLSFLKNSTIGGPTQAHGNIIAGNTGFGIALGDARGNITIENNQIGLDPTGKVISSIAATGISVNGKSNIAIISRNSIVGQKTGIFIDNAIRFLLDENKIGGINASFKNSRGIHIKTSNDGKIENQNIISFNDEGIYVEFSYDINISKNELSNNKIGVYNINASPGKHNYIQQNIIRNNQLAILNHDSYPITLSQNSSSCNTKFLEFRRGNPGVPFEESKVEVPKIEFVSATSLKGTYLPNSIIELFYTDECIDCQGKTYIGSVNTDGSGTWSYSGSFTGPITSTGTNADGATSTFSKPLLIDTDVKIVHVLCGEKTGSIKGIQVYDSSLYRWYDDTGTLVGTEKDLINVGAGKYRLEAGQNVNQTVGCNTASGPYVISGSGNSIDNTKTPVITTDLCNASKGSVVGVVTINDLDRSWYNSSNPNLVISTADDLLNFPAGTYYFTTGNDACKFQSPNYIINNTAIVFTAVNKEIIAANCSLPNGSITINSFQTATPTVFSWLNENGIEVSKQRNLIGQPAGKYKLMASNGQDCSNLAGEFTIPLATKPQINTTALKKFLSCDEKTVSSSGITIEGETAPYDSQWLDANGNTVFNGIDLKEVAPGKYKLKITDKYNCSVESEEIDFTQFTSKTLSLPNIFSPNGDGFNDDWQIKGIENYPNAEFSVFNRNGNLLFFNVGYTKTFDGTFKGQPLPVGVYYYLIDLKGSCKPLSGSLTIIR